MSGWRYQINVHCHICPLCQNYVLVCWCFCVSEFIFFVNAFFSKEFLDACKTGNVGVVLELLECGADPNQADKVRVILQCQYVRWLMILSLQNGWTALFWASMNGHDEIVRVLLAAKATVNTQIKVVSM